MRNQWHNGCCSDLTSWNWRYSSLLIVGFSLSFVSSSLNASQTTFLGLWSLIPTSWLRVRPYFFLHCSAPSSLPLFIPNPLLLLRSVASLSSLVLWELRLLRSFLAHALSLSAAWDPSPHIWFGASTRPFKFLVANRNCRVKTISDCCKKHWIQVPWASSLSFSEF